MEVVRGADRSLVGSIVEVTTTLPDDILADDIAEKMVEQRLVACAQVFGPVESTYLWRGALEQSSECRLSLKTTEGRLGEVIAMLRSRHPYEVPEITVKTFDWVLEEYAKWVHELVGENEGGAGVVGNG